MNSELQAELLKQVLENLRTPERLDEHPWKNSLFMGAYFSKSAHSENKSCGYELAMAVSKMFLEMMPATTPRRGKRLDTRWGEFGLLAAQYFVPFLFGLPYPSSLRDAWGKIDRAILFCKFGEDFETLPALEVGPYRLVGNEPEVAPLSTISDWHVKGIDKLASLILDREQYLSLSLTPSSDSVAPVIRLSDNGNKSGGLRRKRHLISWVVAAAILVALILAVSKAWSIYQLALLVRMDAEQLQGFVASPLTPAKVKTAGPALAKFRQDVEQLSAEAGPALRFAGPWLGFLPVYGQDLASSADLLEFANQTAEAVEVSYQIAAPLLDSAQADSSMLKPQELARFLVDAQPQLLKARAELDTALALRAGLRGREFSPRVQTVLNRLDPILSLLDDGLAAGVALPGLLGAGSGGPKTYMLLVQNSDEIRPTGGFITSVGSFVLKDGNMFGLQFEEAGDLEDWTLPYPDAPWQLEQYMNSQVLVLRDANWFTEYPTTVDWVEYLYAYTHKHGVDGVIAIDQQMLVALLKVIGPLSLEGISIPVTSENVIAYMRQAKVKPPHAPADWYRKAFISQIANALAAKLLSGDVLDWKGLAQMMTLNLNQRHVMLQFDDLAISALLAKWDLDGVIRPGTGDFLMAVDTNVGFNKTNAVIQTRLSYDADLTDLANPTGKLILAHTNTADSTTSCIHLEAYRLESSYPINFCYWNYLRVYVPAGDRLNNASPHAVPADWMLLGQGVPARVDTLEEDITGVQSYGTMMVVPGGQTYNTGFDFSLPVQVVGLDPVSKVREYTLKIKKQPGTIAIPATVRIHLPAAAQVVEAPTGAVVDGQNVLIETSLTTDVVITLRFTVP